VYKISHFDYSTRQESGDGTGEEPTHWFQASASRDLPLPDGDLTGAPKLGGEFHRNSAVVLAVNVPLSTRKRKMGTSEDCSS
jgi:hypothetical protein